jgi:predicted AAA+ superfamily ATPase
MPEAVKRYAETADGRKTRQVQDEITKSYVLDFAKHAPASDVPKLSLIWESIPKHLAKENKKFVFSAVKKSARAREYENALIWLEDAGLIHRATATETTKLPLAHYADRSIFKIYALDVGLLSAISRVPVELLAGGDRLFNEYEGALVENFVSQELTAHFGQPLYYWKSKGGKAEIDFLCEVGDRIVPLEVKAGINPRSKSLRSYDIQFAPPVLARSTLLNFKRDGKILNLPLYAVSFLPSLLP